MQFYYFPGACSIVTHIALREAAQPVEYVMLTPADLGGTTELARAFHRANPKAHVPTLVLDDGSALTETGMLIQYIADRAPGKGLIAPCGSMARYRQLEAIHYIATGIHKGFAPLWDRSSDEATRARAKRKLGERFDYIEQVLIGSSHFACYDYSVADAYLFGILTWTRAHDIDLGRWPTLTEYLWRIAERPAVNAAMEFEGLLEKSR